MTRPLQIVLVLLAPLVLAARPPGDSAHAVALEDVTGTTARPEARPSLLLAQLAASGGSTEVGYPEHPPQPPRPYPHSHRPGQVGVVSLEDVLGPAARPPRPGQVGGVVSLEDVVGPGPGHVGHVGHVGHPPPPPHPGFLGADAYRSPCLPSYAAYPSPYANAVPLGSFKSAGADADAPLSRSRRSPSPQPGGVVRLEDVAGPVGAHYPAFGPPAYVRPARPYNYDYYWNYNRPRPYAYSPYYVLPLPCIGLFCL